MSFGKAGTMHDWTLDEASTEEVVKHALDLGINFFDTASGYSAGTGEEYLGKALKTNVSRDKVVIASRVYFNPSRLSREAIHREIDSSLKRLGTDYLDLYIIRRFDYETPIEETMEALNDLVKAGKSALPGGRAGTHSDLQANGGIAHALQPAGGGAPDPTTWNTDTLRSRASRCWTRKSSGSARFGSIYFCD